MKASRIKSGTGRHLSSPRTRRDCYFVSRFYIHSECASTRNVLYKDPEGANFFAGSVYRNKRFTASEKEELMIFCKIAEERLQLIIKHSDGH